MQYLRNFVVDWLGPVLIGMLGPTLLVGIYLFVVLGPVEDVEPVEPTCPVIEQTVEPVQGGWQRPLPTGHTLSGSGSWEGV